LRNVNLASKLQPRTKLASVSLHKNNEEDHRDDNDNGNIDDDDDRDSNHDGEIEAEGKETTIVADVHTDTNEPAEVLEEGVGYVDLILVAYKVPDGRTIIGAGPTLSYYEFKQPINNRLTDEAWKQMLKSGKPPLRPAWTSSFYQP